MFPRGRPEGATSVLTLRTAPEAPKTAPREGPDGGPHRRFSAFGPKQPPEGAKRSPTDPGEAPKGPKRAPRGPREAPKRPPRAQEAPARPCSRKAFREHYSRSSARGQSNGGRGRRAGGTRGEVEWRSEGGTGMRSPPGGPHEAPQNPPPHSPCCASRGQRGKGAVGREGRWNVSYVYASSCRRAAFR